MYFLGAERESLLLLRLELLLPIDWRSARSSLTCLSVRGFAMRGSDVSCRGWVGCIVLGAE